MNTIKISELLYKRVLIAEDERYSSTKRIKEVKILEASPSQTWIKIMNDVGKKYWVHYSTIIPVEILIDPEPRPKN